MQSFDYAAPKSVEEVIQLLTGKNGDARILAGGTDLLVQLREGRRNAKVIIDIKNIPEFTRVTFDPTNGLRIGAVAPTPLLASAAGDFLAGKEVTRENIKEAV